MLAPAKEPTLHTKSQVYQGIQVAGQLIVLILDVIIQLLKKPGMQGPLIQFGSPS